MGDYAPYVLSAYGVSALAVGALALFTALDARRQRRQLHRLERDTGVPRR